MSLRDPPTGTVGAGGDEGVKGTSSPQRPTASREQADRIAELEAENEQLRAALDRYEDEREDVIARYERLLERARAEDSPRQSIDSGRHEVEETPDPPRDSWRLRLARTLGFR